MALSTFFEVVVELRVPKGCVNVVQQHEHDDETYVEALMVEEEAALVLRTGK